MHDDFKPNNDHEAAMARADLYKLANYSMKLFKMIHEGDNLEGWVQAKVTKAADYIASVYHFMNYEMRSSEYGEKLENSDVYSESVRRVFEQKLMEAKQKAAEVKKRATSKKDEKVEEGFPTVADAKARHEKEKGTGKFDKKKISTGTVYTRKAEKDTDTDDEDTPKTKSKKVKEGFPTVADAKARHEKEKGTGNFDKKKISTGTVYTRKHAADKDEDDTPKSKKVKEGAKPDFLDMDKDGNKKEPMKKAVADKKAGPKKGVNPFVKKDQKVKEGAGCSQTMEGKSCPVHGMKACPTKK